jgi:ribosomal protein L31
VTEKCFVEILHLFGAIWWAYSYARNGTEVKWRYRKKNVVDGNTTAEQLFKSTWQEERVMQLYVMFQCEPRYTSIQLTSYRANCGLALLVDTAWRKPPNIDGHMCSIGTIYWVRIHRNVEGLSVVCQKGLIQKEILALIFGDIWCFPSRCV